MPATAIRVFRAANKRSPLLQWLEAVQHTEPDIFAKCLAFITMLRLHGFDLRRPVADLLKDGIYELRVKNGRPNYRILYFFCGRNVACLSHGLTKEKEVPDGEIEKAKDHRKLVLKDEKRFTAQWEI